MSESANSFSNLASSSRQFARHALAAGENRLELVLVELQEERNRVFLAFGLLLGTAALAMLAGVALTIAVIVVLWPASQVWPIITLTFLYTGGALVLYRRLQYLIRQWQTLPETLDQIRRDRAALAAHLE